MFFGDLNFVTPNVLGREYAEAIAQHPDLKLKIFKYPYPDIPAVDIAEMKASVTGIDITDYWKGYNSQAEHILMMRSRENERVIFAATGEIIVQLQGYASAYNNPSRAAEDVLVWLKTRDTSAWDGHLEDAVYNPDYEDRQRYTVWNIHYPPYDDELRIFGHEDPTRCTTECTMAAFFADMRRICELARYL